MKKYILSGVMGMGFGFPITLLSMTLIGGYNPVVKEFFVWMVASALYGLLSVVMDSKKLEMPMPVSFGLHFFGIVGITLGAAMICGYVTSIVDVLPILVPTVVIYVVVCFVCFLLMKKDEKEINEALENR
jgi:uncharacterized membrane protein AbrB (regulator of aidB expression)